MRATRHLRVALPLASLLAGCLGGCGSSGPKNPSVTAGHGSPAAAAVGFLEAATAQHASEACGYVMPVQQAACSRAFATASDTVSVKDLSVGATTINGRRALVTALGMLCTNSGTKICFSSTDPRGGQPSTIDGFDGAYSAVESGSSANNDPAIPCTMAGDRWYVDLGQAQQPAS